MMPGHATITKPNPTPSGRRRALTLTMFGALACTGSEKSPTPAPPATLVDGHTIIRKEAVGPLFVGEWRRQAMSLVYPVGATAGKDSEDIIVVRGIGKDTMTLVLSHDDTVRRILVKRPGPHTADGIGVGTPFETVIAKAGATSHAVTGARVVTFKELCGVEFATDTLAVSEDTTLRNSAQPRDTTEIRAISVTYCNALSPRRSSPPGTISVPSASRP